MARIMYTDMSGQERSVPFGPEAPVVSIGRATDCTIRSNRKSVSRHHAEFRFSNEQFEIVDLNSSNGTYLIINEERKPVLGREYLAHNDEVWCGDFILRFFEEDAASADNFDDSTYNPSLQQHQHGSTQPPAFGESQHADFGAPSNGHFGGPQHQQPPNQNSWQQRQQGPSFGHPSQSPNFSAPDASFGSEPQYAEPAFQSDVGFGNEPSFGNERSYANDPPNFGEPVGPATINPYEEGSTQKQSGYDHPAFDTSTQNHAELAEFMQGQDVERLAQERDAYAELAERQKGEIEDLQSRLGDVRQRTHELEQELEDLRMEQADSTSVATPPGEVARLRDDLAAALSEAEMLQEQVRTASDDASSARTELEDVRRELEQARADTSAADLEVQLSRVREENSVLEQELATARQMAAEPDHEAQGEVTRLQDKLAGRDRDIVALESEVDRLTAEMQGMEQAATEQARADAQKAREETEALRRELERHKRLVEEFEKRNRELQVELDGAEEETSLFEMRLAEGDVKRTELEAELEALASDLEAARTERDAAQTAVEQMKARGNVDELRNEIEGLKHRLKMEKERAGEGDARLTEEVDGLNGTVADLEAQNHELRSALEAASVSGGATAQDLALLREKVEALDRIVDAIVRTNLDPLSTVDRIRLQSAIRDTDPKTTLATLLDLTSSD